MRTEVPLKYCKVSFTDDWHSDHQSKKMVQTLYATVEFAWGEKANPLALAFSLNMDKRIEAKAREILAPLLKVDAQKDIYLEDTWLMVQGYTEDTKHYVTHLIGIVREFEAQFDHMAA